MIALPLNLLLIPALLMLAVYGLRRLAERVVPISFLRFWLYPGVAVHELSHAVACLPALSKVQSITIFRADGSGEVSHDAPRLGFLGQVLISLAPLAGGVLALWLLSVMLGSPLPFGTVRGDAAQGYGFGWQLLLVTWADIRMAADPAIWMHWQPWVLTVAAFSVSLTMFPSGADLKHAALGVTLILVGLVGWLLVAEYLLGWQGGGALGGAVTRLLGYAHLVLVWFALDLLLLAIVAGLGRLFSGSSAPSGGSAKHAAA